MGIAVFGHPGISGIYSADAQLGLGERCSVPGTKIYMDHLAATKQHFLIFAYPRSRTSWLSAFLTTGQSFCHHEASTAGSVEGIIERLKEVPQKCVGNCDSAMSVVGSELRKAIPGAPVVFIHRDFHESAHSLAIASKRDYEAVAAQMEPYRKAFESLRREIRDALHLQWTDLSDEEACRTLWQWLRIPEPFSSERFSLFNGLNIQPKPETLIHA